MKVAVPAFAFCPSCRTVVGVRMWRLGEDDNKIEADPHEHDEVTFYYWNAHYSGPLADRMRPGWMRWEHFSLKQDAGRAKQPNLK